MEAHDHRGLCTRRSLAALLAMALLPAVPAIAQEPGQEPAAPPAPEETLNAGEDMFLRMTVPVMINGQGPYHFVVDTGSSRSAVCDRVAQELGLPQVGKVRVHTATEMNIASTVRIARLAVGARETANVVAPVFTEANLGAEGMLGLDALGGQKIVMDFEAVSISIGPSDQLDNDPADVVVRARSRYGQLVLLDTSIDEVPLYVIVDTGGQLSVGNLHLQKTLARRRQAQLQQVQVVSVTGDKASADVAALPKMRMGGIEVSNMPIAYADLHAFKHFGLEKQPAMLLGMDTLRYFKRVSVDFKARQVRLLMMKKS